MSDRTSHEIETLTTRIPMRLQRRGGRKLIVTQGAAVPTPKPRRDETLIRALCERIAGGPESKVRKCML